jgi:hypothetical protein
VEVSTKNQPKLRMTQDCALEALLARLAWLRKPQSTNAMARGW